MRRVIGAVFAAALSLTGCEGLPGRPRPDARELVPTEIMTFGPLYARNCAGCHGEAGRLGAARPLNDAVYLAMVPTDRMRQVIATGIQGTAQPAFALSAGGSLTDQQIDVLVQGIKERWQRPEVVADYQVPTYAAGPASSGSVADVDRGRAVFAAVCAGCHGQGGQGGPRGGAVTDPSYLALVSDQHLRTTVIAGRSDLGMPDWRLDGAAASLTPQQISDVVAWLVAQRRPVPGRLP
jgi:cytochrome c oxidase cbb3-type subunit 3/ubiquinol-cytochrome c reductase cytochrome c subunit